jgi:hypothetical protein
VTQIFDAIALGVRHLGVCMESEECVVVIAITTPARPTEALR